MHEKTIKLKRPGNDRKKPKNHGAKNTKHTRITECKIEKNQQNACTPSGVQFLVLLFTSQLLQQLFSVNKEQRKSPLPLRYDIKSKQ